MQDDVTIELTLALGDERLDVVVAAPRETELAELRPHLLAALGATGCAVAPLDLPTGRLRDLRRGAVLAVSSTARRRPVTVVALRIVAGPGAGGVVALGAGRHVVGSAPWAAVRIDHPSISPAHAELDVGAHGVRVRDLGSEHGTTVHGEAVGHAWRPVDGSSRLRLASTTVVLADAPQAPPEPAPVRGPHGGRLGVRPRPRRRQAVAEVAVDLPVPPTRAARPRRGSSVVALLVPVALAVPLAFLWSPLALVFALGGPVSVVATSAAEGVVGRRRGRRAVRQHAAATRAALVRARTLQAQAVERLDDEHPGPVGTLVTGSAPGHRLWERRSAEPDALVVRLGAGHVPSCVSLVRPAGPGPRPALARRLHDEAAPVLVDLAAAGVLGIAGRGAGALARCVVGQAAVQLSPGHLGIVVLVARNAPTAGHRTAGSWSWARWLPHSPGVGGPSTGALVADSPDRVSAATSFLLSVLAQRQAAARAQQGPVARRWLVVVCDDDRAQLRRSSAVLRLLVEGPAVGIVVVCVADDEADLPPECSLLALLEEAARPGVGGAGLVVRRREPAGWVTDVAGAVPDLPPAAWAEQLARGLAPLLDETSPQGGPQASAAPRLLDLLARDLAERSSALPQATLTAEAVTAAWQRDPRSTRAVLGSHDGGTWSVDLRQDGPHVLVAGTTGAGKSEFLAALVVALAAVNAPEELGVLLVDYKGGTAFGPLARLPHAVGLVTDLDDHLTRRVLASLRAEVRRRERILRDHGCRDLDELTDLRRAHAAEGDDATSVPVLGRLLVVVDEFRVLAEELPGFVDGLVRIAAVGRALGLHLVLATQRPAGVVSPDIRANTNLRVALRVRETAESVDVVEAPDAAAIPATRPGRAVVRTGGGLLVAVQVARVTGRPTPVHGGITVRRADADHSATDGGPPTTGPTGRTGATRALAPPARNDLDHVVALLRTASRGRPLPHRPWAPPLPDVVGRSRAAGSTSDGGLLLGLLDDPAAQCHRAARWSADEPLVVVGPPRSGRTSVLRALAADVAARPPDQHCLAVVQVRDGDLADLSTLPHCLGVAAPGDTEHLLRLLEAVTETATRRRCLAAEGRPAASHPRLLLLVDGGDLLLRPAVGDPSVTAEREAAAQLLTRLLVEGPPVGVVPVLTGDRALLSPGISTGPCARLLLRLSDPGDALLAGVSREAVLARSPAGRGVLVTTALGEAVEREVQVAVLDGPDATEPEPDVSPLAQRAALQRLVARSASGWAGHPVLPRVVPLPPRLRASDLARWPDPGGSVPVPVPRRGSPVAVGRPPGALEVALGVGGNDVDVRTLDLATTPLVVVAGQAGSGRTSVLLLLAHQLARNGVSVRVVAARPNALTSWAHRSALPVHLPSAGPADRSDDWDDWDDDVVLVDDLDVLAADPAGDALQVRLQGHAQRTLARGAMAARAPGADASVAEGPRSGAGAVVVAGTSGDLVAAYRGVVPLVRRARTGLLLHPVTAADVDVLGVRVPRRGPGPAGRATLARAGVVEVVQIAAVDGAGR